MEKRSPIQPKTSSYMRNEYYLSSFKCVLNGENRVCRIWSLDALSDIYCNCKLRCLLCPLGSFIIMNLIIKISGMSFFALLKSHFLEDISGFRSKNPGVFYTDRNIDTLLALTTRSLSRCLHIHSDIFRLCLWIQGDLVATRLVPTKTLSSTPTLLSNHTPRGRFH